MMAKDSMPPASGEARFERTLETRDGVRLVWLDYGPADGRTIVLCHGLGAGADQFDADARIFAEHGFRVLVPDLRGHGRSGKPDPAKLENYTIDRMATDLLEMLDAAGAEAVDYVGNSLGGILALHLVKRHPGRFRTLTTFGTATALRLPGFAAGIIPLSYRLVGRRLAGKITAFATTPSPLGRPIIALLVSNFDPQVGRAVAMAVCRYDLTENAIGFPGPYLMLRGARDRQVNAALRSCLPRLLDLPGFKMIELSDAGHCVNLDDPEAFRDALLAFWARTPV